MPPAGPGSLGDEAMLRGLVGSLGLPAGDVGVLDLDQAGGVVPSRCGARTVDVADADRWPRVLAIGADVLDGYYGVDPVRARVELLACCASRGATTAVVNGSLNAAPATTAVELLRRLPRRTTLAWRDPVSLARARRLLDRRGRLTADAAFLMAASRGGAPADLAWIAARRKEGLRPVGVAANALTARLLGDDDALHLHVELIAALAGARPRPAIVLIPHDRRPASDDVALAREIEAEIARTLPVPATVVRAAGAREVKELCAALDVVVSGRMHVAIAALGVGTPVLCMDYQGKVEGLARHMGLPGLSFAPEELRRPGRIAAAAVAAADDSVLRARIRAAAPRVYALAARNAHPAAPRPSTVLAGRGA